SATKMRELMQDLRDQGGDPQDMRRQMQDQMKTIQADATKLVAEYQAKINAELTLDQREQWETSKLRRVVMQRLGMLDLTDDQKSRIEEMIKESGKAIAAIKDPKDTTTATVITGKLTKKIVAEVLSEEQAGKLVLPGPVPMMGGGGGWPGGPGGPGG